MYFSTKQDYGQRPKTDLFEVKIMFPNWAVIISLDVKRHHTIIERGNKRTS